MWFNSAFEGLKENHVAGGRSKYRVFNLKVDRNTGSSTVNRIMKA